MATRKPAATKLRLADRELVDAALAAREGAHAPWSQFQVGAAARFGDQIVKGCNVEFDVYGLTGCAERTAVFAAYACGAARAPMTAIAIVADTPSPVSPCGACRQVLYETGGPDLRVILTNTKGDTQVTTMRELLPGGFRLEGTARTTAVRKAAQRRVAEATSKQAKKSPRD